MAIASCVSSTEKANGARKKYRPTTSMKVTIAMTASAAEAIRASHSVIHPLARPSAPSIEPFTAPSARRRLDHRFEVFEQLAPILPFLLDLLDPVVGHRFQQRLPFLEFRGRQRLDRLTFLFGVVAAAFIGGKPGLADQRRAGVAARLHQRRLVC